MGTKPGFRITELLAYVAVGDDDEEGICAFMAPGGMWHPMIMADRVRFAQLVPIAQAMREQGQKIRLVRFTTREELDERQLMD